MTGGQHDESYPEKGIYESIPYSYSSGKYKSANKFFRGLDWIVLDAFRAYLYVLRSVGKDDVILVYGYSIFMQLAIILAARKVGAKVVKETCEHPSSIVNMSSTKKANDTTLSMTHAGILRCEMSRLYNISSEF